MNHTSYKWRSDIGRAAYAEGKAEGEAKGWAKAILLVLEARGLTTSEHVRQRITKCTDIDQLAIWARRAATADSTEYLLICSAENEPDTPQGREHTAKCKARGLATATLAVSESRGIDIPAGLRQYLMECTDPDLQQTWLIRAVSVEHAKELFA